MLDVKATDICSNCYREFGDHNYVKDSIDEYKCPHPYTESVYGFFHGGDPRNFHPDAEDCSERELENHRLACELWNEAESRGETPEPEKCPSGWVYDDDGKPVMHVLKAPYGIGVSTIEFETCFEKLERDESDDFTEAQP